jgi:cob(I)alamin adenosyltransferase
MGPQTIDLINNSKSIKLNEEQIQKWESALNKLEKFVENGKKQEPKREN